MKCDMCAYTVRHNNIPAIPQLGKDLFSDREELEKPIVPIVGECINTIRINFPLTKRTNALNGFVSYLNT